MKYLSRFKFSPFDVHFLTSMWALYYIGVSDLVFFWIYHVVYEKG